MPSVVNTMKSNDSVDNVNTTVKDGSTSKRKHEDIDDITLVSPKKPKQTPSHVETQILASGVLTYNPFSLLNSNEDLSNLNSRENARINRETFQRRKSGDQTAKAKKQEKCPPIYITELFKDPKAAINAIQEGLQGKAIFKILRNGYNVQIESITDHEALKSKLVDLKIPFYTFTLKENKTSRLVLKGVHNSYSPEEITTELHSLNVKVLNVQPMMSKGKLPLNMFTVSFAHGTKTDEIKSNVKYLCNQKITWQPFIKKSIGTQCRKCQLFGHAAMNCGRNYRCVKCTHDHAPGNCPLEDDQPATCVNCKQNHPANYRKCPKYEEYLSKIRKAKGKKKENEGNCKEYRPSSVLTSVTKSKNVTSKTRDPQRTYSQVLQSADRTQDESSLSFLSNEINELFQCDISVLLQKIKSFVPLYKSQRDPTLKQILIIDFLAQLI